MLYWHNKAVDNYASKCALSNIYIYIRLDLIEGIHYLLDTRYIAPGLRSCPTKEH